MTGLRRTATPAPKMARHVLEEHTGEVRVRLEAPSMEELFAEAGRALAELTLGGGLVGRLGEPVRLEVGAPDRSALLIEWMNELVFRAETEGRVLVAFHFEHLDDRRIVASARGPEFPEMRTLVKAATLHDVQIREVSDGLTATVTLDV